MERLKTLSKVPPTRPALDVSLCGVEQSEPVVVKCERGAVADRVDSCQSWCLQSFVYIMHFVNQLVQKSLD